MGVIDIIDTKIIDSGEIIKPENDKYTEENNLKEGEVFIQIEPSSFAKINEQDTTKYLKSLQKAFRKKAHSKGAKLAFEDQIGTDAENTSKEIEPELITGDVLITRNPCGHEGDIRPAKAIGKDHPAYEKLKHLVNVVVFPS